MSHQLSGVSVYQIYVSASVTPPFCRQCCQTEKVPGGSGVQKLYFCNCEKTFFALRSLRSTALPFYRTGSLFRHNNPDSCMNVIADRSIFRRMIIPEPSS
ncbi:Uncharacterized protein dnm_026490 [Desulfonema magnum]|uniref:Uncharacterized protein n=1 Tax=Desulfonema magnum TaxID=45655 RepID=A0A975GMG0_9BACT|nr:Uncharacterized protein dnm_026490 [Desulfonema magnum]